MKRLISHAAWLTFVAFSARLLPFPEAVVGTLDAFVRIYVILAGGWLLWLAMEAIVATLDALSERYASSKGLLRYHGQLKPLVPVLQRLIEGSIFLIAATLVARQLELTAPLALWGVRLLKIVGFFFISRVAVQLFDLLIEEGMVSRPRLTEEQRKRRQTLVPLAQSAAKYGVYFTFTIAALKQLGIDPTPILAGVGILGLGLSFGSQKLIADLVSGFFILFEGHYLVGDFITVNGVKGKVVAIDLRTTHIRKTYGDYVILRNSDIDKIESCSRDWVLAAVRIPVPYDCDFDIVKKVVAEVGDEMLEEGGRVIGKLGFPGIRDFHDSFVQLAVFAKISAGNRAPVENKIRLRVYERLREHGIAVPVPHRVLSWRADDQAGESPLAPRPLPSSLETAKGQTA